MLKKIACAAAVLAMALYGSAAMASSCPSYTYTLTNGTTADATQVMADFNTIMTCANGSLAPLASPSFSGNVGIGVATPSYPFQIGTALTPATAFTPAQALIDDSPVNTASGAVAAFGIVGQPVPASNSSTTFEGSNVDLSVPSSATVNYNVLIGMQDSVKYSGAGVIGTMHGLSVTANYASAATAGTVRGIVPTALNSSTGSVQNLQGAIVTAQNSSSGGVTGGAYGLYSRVLATGSGALTGFAVYGLVQNSGTAVLPAAYGIMGEPRNSSTGTITVAYGGNFDVQNTGGGTITTSYGVYVGSVAGTTKYSLYASDSTAPNYFAGNVGIGTATPAVALSVVGTIRQTNCTTAGTLSANASGDIICTSDGRLKNILGDYSGGLDALAHITPKLFTFRPTKSDPVETFVHAGFIAQNVMAVIPQASALQHDGYYSLDTTAILATAVNSIKQLKAIVDKQSAEIAQLKARLRQADRQAAAIDVLRADIAALRQSSRQRTAAR